MTSLPLSLALIAHTWSPSLRAQVIQGRRPQTMSIDADRSPEEQEKVRKAYEERQQRQQEDQQKMLQQIMSGIGGAAGAGGGGDKDKRRRNRQTASEDGGGSGGGGSSGGDSSGGSFSATGGSMQSCGSLPANVAKNLQELQDFRKNCRVANTGSNQKFAINDYSCKNGQPMMYLFDTNGTCEKKMPVTFGNGSGSAANSCPKACSVDKTHLTPPGFHLTAPHLTGSKYKPFKKGEPMGPNASLLMVGLEGQGSAKRAILIHGAQSPGTASSWGCSGVGQENLMAVLNYLGNDALVYNAFDPSQLSCGSSAGMRHDASSCRKDPGAPATTPARQSSGPGQTSQ